MILLVLALLTVNPAASRPERIIIRESTLIYPAGSYYEKNPMFLSIHTSGNYSKVQNQMPTLNEAPGNSENRKEDISPYNSDDQTNRYRKFDIGYCCMRIDNFLFSWRISDVS